VLAPVQGHAGPPVIRFREPNEPGTEEAKNAVLIAQIPKVMEIDPKSAAAQAKVSSNGDPHFAPIEERPLLRNEHCRQSDQGWRRLLIVPAGHVVHVSERPGTLDDGQFRCTSDLHNPAKFAGLQRDLRVPDNDIERICGIQSHGWISRCFRHRSGSRCRRC